MSDELERALQLSEQTTQALEAAFIAQHCPQPDHPEHRRLTLLRRLAAFAVQLRKDDPPEYEAFLDRMEGWLASEELRRGS
jgi:hypothetical protein